AGPTAARPCPRSRGEHAGPTCTSGVRRAAPSRPAAAGSSRRSGDEALPRRLGQGSAAVHPPYAWAAHRPGHEQPTTARPLRRPAPWLPDAPVGRQRRGDRPGLRPAPRRRSHRAAGRARRPARLGRRLPGAPRGRPDSSGRLPRTCRRLPRSPGAGRRHPRRSPPAAARRDGL
ncbi:MAG: hypothetical protein AVDCRST_MAG07-2146, partial [uncultured Frankineae bacterium]